MKVEERIMPQLWEPKDLLKALKDHEEVNLRHIATRRDKGLLEPDVKAERPGERTKYGAFNSLLYVVATKFEKAGFSIEAAYHAARNILTLQFIESMAGENHLWIVEINNDKFFPLTSSGCDLPWQFKPQKREKLYADDKEELPPPLNIDDFVRLIPTEGVYLFAPRTLISALPAIETIKYYNASMIVHDSVMRLDISDREIKILEADCRKNTHIKFHGSKNLHSYDFDYPEGYDSPEPIQEPESSIQEKIVGLTKIAQTLTPGGDAHAAITVALNHLRRRLDEEK